MRAKKRHKPLTREQKLEIANFIVAAISALSIYFAFAGEIRARQEKRRADKEARKAAALELERDNWGNNLRTMLMEQDRLISLMQSRINADRVMMSSQDEATRQWAEEDLSRCLQEMRLLEERKTRLLEMITKAS